MAKSRVVWAVLAAGVLAGGTVSGCSKSETPAAESTASETTAAETSAPETSAPETKAPEFDPSKYIDPQDPSVAVGTGEFLDPAGDSDPATNTLVGFVASGATNEEASATVIKACQDAGGVECTADEVTNDDLCIVSVASDATDVVAGGAGATVEEAKQDALRRAEANGTPEGPDAVVVVSNCNDE